MLVVVVVGKVSMMDAVRCASVLCLLTLGGVSDLRFRVAFNVVFLSRNLAQIVYAFAARCLIVCV